MTQAANLESLQEKTQELGCSWIEANLALRLAAAIGYPIKCRQDGRWYAKEPKA